jgi:tetratricopeptide (TPR) repeat protein
VQSARLPAGARLDIGSDRQELQRAESLFRRSLASNPRHAEARVRLGRVLALLGRPVAAVQELRTALADTTDRLLLYYALLCLGDAAESAGDLERARQAYADARALYPRAQSPRLALSQMANRTGDRRTALGELQAAMALANGPDGADPWWTYSVAAGRDARARIAAVYDAVDPQWQVPDPSR